MKKLRQFWRYRITQLIGGALLVGAVLPFIAGLVLKVFGFLHGTSLHSWLLDVGHHIPPLGAAGGAGAGAGAGSGGPGDPPPKTKSMRFRTQCRGPGSTTDRFGPV